MKSIENTYSFKLHIQDARKAQLKFPMCLKKVFKSNVKFKKVC